MCLHQSLSGNGFQCHRFLNFVFMDSHPRRLSPVSLQLPTWINWLPTAELSIHLNSSSLPSRLVAISHQPFTLLTAISRLMLFKVKSRSYVMTNGQLASLSWFQARICGLWSNFCYCQTCGSLWWEDRSVVYNCFWPSPAQPSLVPSPAGFMTTFYCLRFETSPTWRPRSLYLYTRGTGWSSYIPRHWITAGCVTCSCCSLYSLGTDHIENYFPVT
jgi:hypothetical protein